MLPKNANAKCEVRAGACGVDCGVYSSTALMQSKMARMCGRDRRRKKRDENEIVIKLCVCACVSEENENSFPKNAAP